MNICPACDGKAHLLAHINLGDQPHEWREAPCSLCDGAGQIDDEKLLNYRRGQEFQRTRIARNESILECAKRLGVRPSELSAWEHGRRATLGVVHAGCDYLAPLGAFCNKCGAPIDGCP